MWNDFPASEDLGAACFRQDLLDVSFLVSGGVPEDDVGAADLHDGVFVNKAEVLAVVAETCKTKQRKW